MAQEFYLRFYSKDLASYEKIIEKLAKRLRVKPHRVDFPYNLHNGGLRTVCRVYDRNRTNIFSLRGSYDPERMMPYEYAVFGNLITEDLVGRIQDDFDMIESAHNLRQLMLSRAE